MVKKEFDVPLQPEHFPAADTIIQTAREHDVSRIINVGTSLVESLNCIELAQQFENSFAVVGIHPNDCTPDWRNDMQELKKYIKNHKEHKIVGIGETGLDYHYPDYDARRQADAFKVQIELALEYDLALVVHTRNALDETASILDEFKHDLKRGIIHCFSGDRAYARDVINMGFAIGLGGTITYPKNDELRAVAINVDLSAIVLETDAPFLPPQSIRGKKNHPLHIQTIAHYLAEIRKTDYTKIAHATTTNATHIFQLKT